ncbi:MAG: 5'/3'-nucleotidase SurE [Gammaproteobacteria bacterium]
MRFLLSNDDGYQATGLKLLAQQLAELGDITVVAPDRNRSGASNSLTLNDPLLVQQAENGFYYVNGTPTDCVHLAITGLLETLPDMVIAGINHGANVGDDVLYSGTVAAAMEGRFLGKPALAFSLAGGAEPQHFDTAATLVRRFTRQLLSAPLADDLLLNINIPDVPLAEIEAFRLTRLGSRHKAEATITMQDSDNRTLYRIGPPGAGADAGPGTDFHALLHNCVSITPLQLDLTQYDSFTQIQDWIDNSALNEA